MAAAGNEIAVLHEGARRLMGGGLSSPMIIMYIRHVSLDLQVFRLEGDHSVACMLGWPCLARQPQHGERDG